MTTTDTAADLVDALKQRGFRPRSGNHMYVKGCVFVALPSGVHGVRMTAPPKTCVDCSPATTCAVILAAIDAALAQQEQTRTDADTPSPKG